MRRWPGSAHPQSRIALIVSLLVLTLGLAGALAYEAQTAVRQHQRTTRAVLGDYAKLAAEEYSRRVAMELDYYAFAPSLERLASFDPHAGARRCPRPRPCRSS